MDFAPDRYDLDSRARYHVNLDGNSDANLDASKSVQSESEGALRCSRSVGPGETSGCRSSVSDISLNPITRAAISSSRCFRRNRRHRVHVTMFQIVKPNASIAAP